MKKTFILITLFILGIGFSQNKTQLQVSESPEFKDEEKSIEVLAIYTSQNGNTGTVRSTKKGLLVDVFDSNLNKIFSEVIKEKEVGYFKGYVGYGNEIKFITSYSPKRKERIVYCHTLNIDKQTFKTNELFNTTVESSNLFGGRSKRETNIAVSPNGQYFAIATDNIKKTLNSYMIRVFDTETLTLVFEKSYLEDKDNYFEKNDFFVDNAANVYMLGKLFISGKSQKKGSDANYDFVLSKISKDNYKMNKIEMGEDMHISSLAINYFEGKANLLGFYSEKNINNIKGGCVFEIDASNLAIVSKKTVELPKDVYEGMYGTGKAERHDKKKKELKSFYIDYVVTDDLGNTYLLAEEFYITQTYVPNGMNGGSYVTTYHYDDVLILKFDKNRELNWGKSIFKRSNSPSYNAFLKDDKLHVLLNTGKNLTEKSDGRTKLSKGWFESTALFDVTYTKEGEVLYNKIQDNNGGNNFYSPYYGTYNDGKFIMISDGRKKRQFMILE